MKGLQARVPKYLFTLIPNVIFKLFLKRNYHYYVIISIATSTANFVNEKFFQRFVNILVKEMVFRRGNNILTDQCKMKLYTTYFLLFGVILIS